MLSLTQLIGFGTAGAANPSISYVTSVVSATDLTTYTFASVSFGSPRAGSLIIGVTGGSQNRTVSTLTAGGVSATLVKSQKSGDNASTAEIWIVTPTADSGDIVVTWSGAQNRCGIGVWAAFNINQTATATAGYTNTPLSGTLAIPANGIAVGVTINQGSGATCTWTNMTERYDEQTEASNTEQSGADRTATSAETPTITADWTSELSHALALAAWGA